MALVQLTEGDRLRDEDCDIANRPPHEFLLRPTERKTFVTNSDHSHRVTTYAAESTQKRTAKERKAHGPVKTSATCFVVALDSRAIENAPFYSKHDSSVSSCSPSQSSVLSPVAGRGTSLRRGSKTYPPVIPLSLSSIHHGQT